MGISRWLTDALFPAHVVCMLCGKETILGSDDLCDACRAQLTRYHAPLPAPDELDGLVAGLLYDDVTRRAILRFKYEGQDWLAPYLANAISIPEEWHVDCLVPVPLHPLREWRRGFNQSELIARALQARYPYPVEKRLLRRTRYTTPQAKLGAAARLTNLVGAFAASPRAAGKSILLIDDVTTTHSTLIACAAALRQAGVGKVYGACVCAAQEHVQRAVTQFPRTN